ncbi:class C sortase [Arcanobacterium hippocoleae]|uniref:class C sortase n=1 Tax=Arcanobacterium hippocoleae TaxID=149017 RepID=UPI003342E250
MSKDLYHQIFSAESPEETSEMLAENTNNAAANHTSTPSRSPHRIVRHAKITTSTANTENTLQDATQDPAEPKKRRWKIDWPVTLAVTVVLLGIILISYPVISSVWNNDVQRRSVETYEKFVKNTPVQERQTALKTAQEYNAKIDGVPVFEPRLSFVRGYQEYQDYLRLLHSGDGTMAALEIPKINLKLPIYHGTDDATLRRGLGHLYGSDLPVGGQTRHSVITGHTGMVNATLFDRLIELRKGDEFFIKVQGEELGYKVSQIKTVTPKETSTLVRVKGRDLVTLITCTPYGINSHRLLITAERVIPTPKIRVPAARHYQAGCGS